MNSIKFNKRIGGNREFGQGLTEFTIVIALVALGAIGLHNMFGKTIRDQTSAMACGLAGSKSCSTGQSTTAGTDATTSRTDADTQ